MEIDTLDWDEMGSDNKLRALLHLVAKLSEIVEVLEDRVAVLEYANKTTPQGF